MIALAILAWILTRLDAPTIVWVGYTLLCIVKVIEWVVGIKELE